jgi:hypothetical protein
MASFLDPQSLVSGAYLAEASGWITGFTMVAVRMYFSAKKGKSIRKILDIRVGRFAGGLGLLLLLGFINRTRWWGVHSFSDKTYFLTDYIVAAISLLHCVALYIIVKNMNGKEDEWFGVPNSHILLVVCVVAFFVSTSYYAWAW